MNTDTTESDTPTEEETLPRKATLSQQDRCDSCNAQAFAHITLKTGELLLCGHHFTKSETKLTTLATSIVDERWQLTGERLDVSH